MSPPDWRAALPRHLPTHRWRTRFAPAPTGFLHLGHVVNAIHVWGVARAYGGDVVLRVEDHDGIRCRPEYEAALLEDLEWLGFTPDLATTDSFRHERTAHPMRQSNQGARYEGALARLAAQELVYPCRCSRRTIAEAGLLDDGSERRYPGTCAAAQLSPQETLARRVRIAPGDEAFTDLRLGPITQSPALQCGDLLVRDRHGHWTYQFAVTVDDLVHGIDVIIRGEDLLASTGRQLRLRRLLGCHTPPQTLHHALLYRPDGLKLSKANHDTAVREWRAQGHSAAAVIGAAAHACGLAATDAPCDADAVAALFRVS